MSEQNIPNQEKKESYFFKTFKEGSVAYIVVALINIVIFLIFMGLAILPYVLGEKAHELYGIQNWFHQFLWWIHIPLSIIGVPIMFLYWEYYFFEPFYKNLITGKPYPYLFPRLHAWAFPPVPQGQLHKDY